MAETTPNPTPENRAEADRRKMMAERRKRSGLWRVIHLLGSLNLALTLLFVLALACAAATVTESNFNTKIAQIYIYKNPLFTAWIVILCVNLFCVTLTRLPWQRKHTGFIITHYGIITLLAGAMIGRATGFEAFITLDKGQPPKNILSTNDPILFVENPKTGLIGTTPMETEIKRPTPEKPRVLPVEGTDLEIVVDRFSDQLVAVTEILGDPVLGVAPGIFLQLSSAAIQQNLNVPLLLQNGAQASFDMFGLAKIEWVEKLPPLPNPKAQSLAKPATYRESQMIFARQPDIPVVHNTSGKPSGYRFNLQPKTSASGFDLEVIFPNSQRKVIDLQDALKNPFPGETPPTRIVVAQYWPDLRMVNGQPTSVSETPNNPAALITFSGLLEDPAAKTPRLLLAPGETNQIRYQLWRGPNVVRQGELTPGEKITPGWNDWVVELKQFSPRARLISSAREAAPGAQAGTLPGLRFFLRDRSGRTSPPVWIAMGSSETLILDSQRVRVGYGNRIIQIPFGVSLVDFQVPRDEGTTTPANFISSVEFFPPDGSAPVSARSEMNFPASYPPAFWRQLTGDTYKFSQAGWNPQNLNETTLQVLHDPGWLPKWMGSLMICVGIFTMFYLKPKKSSLPSQTAPAGNSS